MKKDYTNQALIKGVFAVRCLLLLIQALSVQILGFFQFIFREYKIRLPRYGASFYDFVFSTFSLKSINSVLGRPVFFFLLSCGLIVR
jgi:hypothetical protein